MKLLKWCSKHVTQLCQWPHPACVEDAMPKCLQPSSARYKVDGSNPLQLLEIKNCPSTLDIVKSLGLTNIAEAFTPELFVNSDAAISVLLHHWYCAGRAWAFPKVQCSSHPDDHLCTVYPTPSKHWWMISSGNNLFTDTQFGTSLGSQPHHGPAPNTDQ